MTFGPMNTGGGGNKNKKEIVFERQVKTQHPSTNLKAGQLLRITKNVKTSESGGNTEEGP